MVTGGIGNEAVNILIAHGVDVVRNCKGDATEIVEKYRTGEVKYGESNCAAHEDAHDFIHI